MKVELEIEDYSKESGFFVPVEKNSKIEIKLNEKYNSLVISANKEGLLTLGKTFISLIHEEIPSDYHVHLSEGENWELLPGSIELIIEKKK